jgi:hypothetical protein
MLKKLTPLILLALIAIQVNFAEPAFSDSKAYLIGFTIPEHVMTPVNTQVMNKIASSPGNSTQLIQTERAVRNDRIVLVQSVVTR